MGITKKKLKKVFFFSFSSDNHQMMPVLGIEAIYTYAKKKKKS